MNAGVGIAALQAHESELGCGEKLCSTSKGRSGKHTVHIKGAISFLSKNHCFRAITWQNKTVVLKRTAAPEGLKAGV